MVAHEVGEARIGHLDADGFLFITDRKKELLKTSGGKLVAPQPIENKLKANLLVAQAALIGDRHKFISVLISPNFVALEQWAANNGVKAATREDLVQQVQMDWDRVREVVTAEDGLPVQIAAPHEAMASSETPLH